MATGFRIYFSIIKGPLSLMNAATAFLGYSAGLYCQEKIYSGAGFGHGLLIFLAVFILSGGSAALNNYQDRIIDSRVKRTQDRPVPRGLVDARRVFTWSLLQICLSLCILAALTRSLWAVLAALAAVLLYNGLYTPLKKRTLSAFFPGALSGAMPPVIGWFASGAGISIPTIAYMTAALILWQMPHFWLLMLSDPSGDSGGILPSFYSYFPRRKLVGLCLIWIASFSISILVLPLFLVRNSGSLSSLYLLSAIVCLYVLGLCAVSVSVFRHRDTPGTRRNYSIYNTLGLLFTVFLSAYFLAG